MKKITFILMSLISAASFAQATGRAAVRAEIVEAISIENGSDLYFGKIDAAGGGNVRVAADGTRTFSNNDMNITSTDSHTAALFEVTAANGISYNVTIPATQLNGATSSETMDITFTHNVDDVASESYTGTGSPQNLNVGGLLSVNAGQAADLYEGTVTVTVSYE